MESIRDPNIIDLAKHSIAKIVIFFTGMTIFVFGIDIISSILYNKFRREGVMIHSFVKPYIQKHWTWAKGMSHFFVE